MSTEPGSHARIRGWARVSLDAVHSGQSSPAVQVPRRPASAYVWSWGFANSQILIAVGGNSSVDGIRLDRERLRRRGERLVTAGVRKLRQVNPLRLADDRAELADALERVALVRQPFEVAELLLEPL